MKPPAPVDPWQREEALLAPYATRARESRGRFHAEPEDRSRTPFQRDRDRIIHSTAFRRLEYKTQVFVNHEGDHYRTRLTHTLEVAQIARGVARALGLNEDLVEAVALSHDLGHPPFGHAGEEALDALMANAGGFEHNRQCLRVVTLLEQRYPDFPGLNLTWEVREAIAKHSWPAERNASAEYEPESAPSLEAQLVDTCDSLAYANHDIDDGIRSGYLPLEELARVELWRRAEERVRERWPRTSKRTLVARTVSGLIDAQVHDLIAGSLEGIQGHGVTTIADARRARQTLIAFTPAMQSWKDELHRFLDDRLYHHPRTLKMAGKGKRFIAAIFERYHEEPRTLPAEHFARVEADGLERVICDYIAGMTDRYCNQEYMRLFVPFADGGGGGA